jgi:hypothetical protein
MRPATIANLEDDTSEDRATGAMRSVQAADLLMAPDALAQIWFPANLERLARTYWRFLTRVTLGLIQVRYSETERSIVLLARPFKLLTFHAPEYEMSASHGLVRWRIARGVLVSRRGRDGGGYLQIDVRRDPAKAGHADAGNPDESSARAQLHVEVEVANFYPSISSRLSRRFYGATQSRIHVIISNAFLRSLARLDLAESRVRRFDELKTD